MAKVVAPKTKQLSVRIDTVDRERVDEIRDVLHERNGIRPQRSDVVRECLTLGIGLFCQDHDIKLKTQAPVKEPLSTTRKTKRSAARAAA